MDFELFLTQIEDHSKKRIKDVHHLSKRIWEKRNFTPTDVQNRCKDEWDKMQGDIGCEILPLIPTEEGVKIQNLIFGSGSFSTGKFQAKQYEKVLSYANNPPVILQGIVSNKSAEHNCNAQVVAQESHIPLIEVDYIDWYHNFVDKNETNPIGATRYWYNKEDENSPSLTELSKRFNLRQYQFHKILGEEINKTLKNHTSIVSARGYNFQFCSSIFAHQSNHLPHINDTHPADLSYIDPKTKEKLYAGWQAGAIETMLKDKLHSMFHGSLIEVEFMDNISQINSLDEGALLALGEGVKIPENTSFSASEIQEAMKIMDDYFFCTLEATGLLLFYGITSKPVPIVFQDLKGNPVITKQRAIIVGNKFRSGVNVWGKNLKKDLLEIENFLFK